MSEHPQAKRASQAWWIAVILGAAAAVASFFVGGSRDGGKLSVEAGLIAAALNPLLWLGAWAFFFRVNFENQLAKCPHCGKWIDLSIYGSTSPALSEMKCPECPHIFIKPPA
jgi:hypothetical protein